MQLDTSRAPLMLAYFRGGNYDHDVQRYLEELRRIAERPFALVVVTSPTMPFMPARQATMHAQFVLEHHDLLRANTAGLALVLTTALARGAFRAIRAMAPLPCPWEEFSQEATAIAWAQGQLQGFAHAPGL